MKDNLIKVLKLMIPFTPHLAHECLEILDCGTADKWPEIKENIVEKVKFAVQVNGKTRDILTVKKNIAIDEIDKIVKKESKAKKFIENKKISKTIFVKNRILNYIIKK